MAWQHDDEGAAGRRYTTKKSVQDRRMKPKPVVSSLIIKKLFGKNDISIHFRWLTVLVGKNGLGKTTLLKIIYGLITGNRQVDYRNICESIELHFTDGDVISYGTVSNNFLNVSSSNALTNMVLKSPDFTDKILDLFSGMEDFPKKVREEVAKSIVKEVVAREGFTESLVEYFAKSMQKNKNVVLASDSIREDLRENLNIRYISTVNISANAGSTIDIGNSVEKNLLDLAIHEELNALLISPDRRAAETFVVTLNEFFKESGKEARLEGEEWVFDNGGAGSLKLGQLSSGERQLVYILATAANTCGKQTLFLMDEPEVSLHLSWQEKIIDAIAAVNPGAQIIVVTHSPGIVMNGHQDAYVEVKDLLTGVEGD